MIYTEQEIESIVSKVKGTHIKRNNLRRKLSDESNKEVLFKIATARDEIRKLKASGASQQDLRNSYAAVTALELMIL